MEPFFFGGNFFQETTLKFCERLHTLHEGTLGQDGFLGTISWPISLIRPNLYSLNFNLQPKFAQILAIFVDFLPKSKLKKIGSIIFVKTFYEDKRHLQEAC